jgi:predicted outer membrane repeat protein
MRTKKMICFASLVLFLALVGSAAADPVPPPWDDMTIGNDLPVGSADYNPAVPSLQVTGDGHDIWDFADDFHYVYKEWSDGDCELICRVASFPDGPDDWQKAGLMVRQNLTEGSQYAFVCTSGTGGNGCMLQSRDTAGSFSDISIEASSYVTEPEYIMLVRIGNLFRGYHSEDGNDWTELGSGITVAMSDPVYIGYAVTSRSIGDLVTATFDNFGADAVFRTSLASSPEPYDSQVDVLVDASLSWLRGEYCLQDDVYFGTDPAALSHIATIDTLVLPPLVEFTQDLIAGTTYYWRVDETDSNTTHTGELWSFTTVSGKADIDYPADGAVIEGEDYPFIGEPTHIWTMLNFNPGPTAVRHTGYCSENYNDVLLRAQDANLGPPPNPTVAPYRYYAGLPEVPPYIESLERGKAYYWCVDETDEWGDTFAGDIWKFTILGYEAFEPSPPDGETFVSTDPLLCWSESIEAQEYDVYIGTDWNDVNDALGPLPPSPMFLGTVTGTCIQVYGLEFNTKYYWRVDAVANRIFPGTGTIYKGDVWCFTTVPEGLGTIRMDLWWSGCPPFVFSIDLPPYPCDPDEIRYLTSFNSGVGLGEDYGGMIHGWLHPKESGDYTFWICSDDESQLYLSTDESPANMQLIAQETSWTNPMTWKSGGEEQSVLIPLIGGRRYYIRALWQEDIGGDHCMVAWQGPDQPLEPVDDQDFAIIPGNRLSPFVQFCAYDPDPCDGQTNVALPVTLRWEEGDYAAQHDVYIGTDRALVESRDGSAYMERVSISRYDPIGLIPNQTYYWVIDEVNEAGPAPYVWPGDVWSFTTEPRRIYVDMDAAGANNGTSWENAYNYLQDALAEARVAPTPVEIRVAQGIYTPDCNSSAPTGTGDRRSSFLIVNKTSLKGGYAGAGTPDPNARNVELYETILSGDLDDNDVGVNDPCDLLNEPTRAENSYHVVTGSSTDQTAVLDGFTITAGHANGLPPKNSGGGLHRCNAEVYNCIITWNWADIYGGGMYNQNYPGESVPIIENCTFSNNAAGQRGGGMYNDYTSSPPRLSNCKFKENSAILGGGMCNYESSPVLTNCVFSGNSASQNGGGMFSDTFPCKVKVINCTFSHNSAGQYGGAIFCGDESEPQLVNSIFWDNTAAEGLQIAVDPAYYDSLLVSYCNVQGGKDDIYGYDSKVEWGEGNIDAAPCFANSNNIDYHLKSQAGRWDANSQSWVLDDVTSPCIDAGNPGCAVGDEILPNGNRKNMGAYGGTAEASKSPPNWRSIADMTNDWVVDSNDLKVYVEYWLESGECIPADLDRSQFVDFDDFAIFGQQWSYPSAFGPGMTFQIDDCNMDAGISEEPCEPRFSVSVQGSYIHFEDLMYANCCPDELGLEKEINGNHITLYEIGYGGLCDCMCYFPITATLGPFEDGIYTVQVIDNYGQSLGVVEVTIGQSAEPTIVYQIEDCNTEASGVFSAEPPDLIRFTVTVEGLYIHFRDMMVANCCPDELGLEMTVEDNLITIYETEYTPGGCFCICDYPVTATLGPFEPGTYTLEVYEEWSGFIGSTTVVIPPTE